MTYYPEGIGQSRASARQCHMIKKIKGKLLLVAIIATSILLPTAVRAIGIEINVGDRPYYSHGPRYWDNEYEMVWVPGHMSRGGHWIHGQYVRSEHRRHDSERRQDGDGQFEHHNDDNRR